jgi:hypothetical protein
MSERMTSAEHGGASEPEKSNPSALIDQVIEELYARHTVDTETAGLARRDYEERRGRVHQDDELWEAWSAAFVEWYVVERAIKRDGRALPAAVASYQAFVQAGDPRAEIVRALVTSHRSLFEIRAMARGRASGQIELLDLLGGGEVQVVEQRALHGVEVGDVAELRLVGVAGEVRFGRTFIYHPSTARAAIVERARAMFANGAARRDIIDQVAQLRVQVTRYRHMPPSRVYELGSRIMG